MAKDAVHGAPDAEYYFAANMALVYAALVYLIGYPFVIVTALGAAMLVLLTIVMLTALDVFDNDTGKRRERHAAHRISSRQRP